MNKKVKITYDKPIRLGTRPEHKYQDVFIFEYNKDDELGWGVRVLEYCNAGIHSMQYNKEIKKFTLELLDE